MKRSWREREQVEDGKEVEDEEQVEDKANTKPTFDLEVERIRVKCREVKWRWDDEMKISFLPSLAALFLLPVGGKFKC